MHVGDTMADGTRLTARLRALYAAGHERGELTEPPDAEPGSSAFAAWLSAPHPDPAYGGVSRFLAAVYDERPDLRAAYPDLRDAETRAGYAMWASVHGVHELPMPAWLAPHPDLRADDPLARRDGVAVGVNVVGYFQSELGVGEAARRVVRALDAAHVPLLPVQGIRVPPSRRGETFRSAAASAAPFDVNLICINADGLPEFAAEVGSAFFEHRWNIGVWWWELADLPEHLRAAANHLDEIWVGSAYVRDAVADAVDVPVHQIVLPVETPVVHPRSRQELGLPEGFLALAMFDFNSVMERKNPLGAIEAFRRAFPSEDVRLAIKCINGEQHPQDLARLRAAVAADPRITLIERYVAAGERDALMATCDVYLSLHRAEGFGLTIAEAMALGRPVIATGYSGNVDFMTSQTGWLVPFALVPVGPGNEPYPASGRWAQPDLDAAAAALRDAYADPEATAHRGEEGRRLITTRHAPQAAGEGMRRRLEQAREKVARRAAAGIGIRAAEVRSRLDGARERTAVGPEAADRDDAGIAARGARQAAIRAARPVIENERVIHRSMLDGVEAVVGDLIADIADIRESQGRLAAAALASERALEARIRALEARLGSAP